MIRFTRALRRLPRQSVIDAIPFVGAVLTFIAWMMLDGARWMP